MGIFLLKRNGRMLLVLFAISGIVFLLFTGPPGAAPAPRIPGRNATPALVAQVEETWGFDDPLPQQYLTMMKLIFTGELIAYQGQYNVDEEIWKGLPAPLSLCIGAAGIWVFLRAFV